MSHAVGELARRVAKGMFAVGDVFFGRWPGPKLLIYHQITSSPRLQLDLHPRVLARHLDWLETHGRVVTLDSVLENSDRGAANDHFVLTFDDGFKGLYEHAFPMLRERGMPFTLYITSSMVESASRGESDEMLTWDHVNEMIGSGLVTVGAHTHTHPDLRSVTEADARDEIATSNEIIERCTGVIPRHFAYPKGYWSAVAEPVVRASYESAVLGAGTPVTSTSDFYRLGRIAVQRSDGIWFFRWKARWGMRFEERVRSRLKGYSNPASTGPLESSPS